MEISGKIIVIEPTKAYGAKNFKKRLFVVETDEKYPQQIPVEFTGDKVTLLDKYKPGQSATVSVNVRGRGWENPQGETKYFLSLEAWRIDGGEAEADPFESNNDDLPF